MKTKSGVHKNQPKGRQIKLPYNGRNGDGLVEDGGSGL